ncbi:Tetratricopeptide repeat,Tetratricopeptide repeat-containing domain,Tetratricopeptide-like helical [Cinara cedri]|uniref:Tetratricopeptide repeat,Tetratricopeptide repeat-containing domain,Tetratricopeptide-like helical n=1 Tax=Cinara cedri TaxID=506608 RepID=A0A5E4M5T2_9HEMI|nr:Tetratricopeptide repeat,Tetratricopeptide repeat-containing domain,Tetratricopeptide-like helical [Cinara cedri]
MAWSYHLSRRKLIGTSKEETRRQTKIWLEELEEDLVRLALNSLLWKNSIPDAFNLLGQALNIDPKCYLAYETLGTVYIETGKLKEALDCLEKAIPLAKSEKELLRIFSLRNSAQARLAASERFAIIIPKVE